MVFEVVIGRSKGDYEKHGTKGAVFLGKQYIKMGETTSLSNPVYLDIANTHVVFVVGKRGSGKCLHGDTLIPLSDGSQVKIKDLEKNSHYIFTLGPDFKIREGLKTNFYKRKVNKLLEIKLRTGKTIKLTPEHPLLTVKGWVPAEQLYLGSRIATPRKLEAFGEKAMKEFEVKLLAYLLAEGHLSNRFVLFANSDEKIVSDFKNCIKKFDPNLRIERHSKSNCFRVAQIKKKIKKPCPRNHLGQFADGPSFDHSSIRNWLELFHLYEKSSLTKFIPREIFILPKHQLSLFLNRLFSCDGTIYKKGEHWFISYCSSSNELISQVQHLLLRFGIISIMRKKVIKNKFYSNELLIYGENVNTYLQEIGFYGKKEERAALALQESIKIIRNPNLDPIPKEILGLYKPKNWAEIGRNMMYAYPKALRESIHYAPSRQKLLQIAKIDESDLLLKLATSDIFWDEVISITVLEGVFEVYDITVPETHNFVANDFIVHNSYTMGVIAEGIADLPWETRQNLAVILLDTMGVYWTMKYPNYAEAELLKEWGMEPKPLDVKIYTPAGFYQTYKEKGIPTDAPFSIMPEDLDPEDWAMTFGLAINSPAAVLIARVVHQAWQIQGSSSIPELIEMVKKDKESDEESKQLVISHFQRAESWGIFAKEGTPLKGLAKGGQITILDLSPYATLPSGWLIKSLVIGLISERLFRERMVARKAEEYSSIDTAMHFFLEKKEKLEEPLIWLIIDEAHEFLPKEGKTTASDALITLLREGRQPGIGMILASQQPGKIHTDVITQSDIVISHRLTAKVDVEALGQLMQSYMRKGLDEELHILPREPGAALVFDDLNERIFPIGIKPRITWHGGSTPTALIEKKEF